MKTILAENPHLATKPLDRAHVFFQTRKNAAGIPYGHGLTLELSVGTGHETTKHRVTAEIAGPLTAPKVAAALKQLAEGVA